MYLLNNFYPSTSLDLPVGYRVTTCLENLEMSEILTTVSEMSGILLKVRELSGKKSCQRKVTYNCLLLAACLILLSLCISFWLRLMHYCIPTPTTDNNTSTGMI